MLDAWSHIPALDHRLAKLITESAARPAGYNHVGILIVRASIGYYALDFHMCSNDQAAKLKAATLDFLITIDDNRLIFNGLAPLAAILGDMDHTDTCTDFRHNFDHIAGKLLSSMMSWTFFCLQRRDLSLPNPHQVMLMKAGTSIVV